MRSVVVTGMAVITAAGEGVTAFEAALREGRPLGEEREVPLPRGRRGRVRAAPLGGWDANAHLSSRERRKMSPEAQALCAAFIAASRGAGTPERPVAPERVGTFLGSGFGCMNTTEDYLRGLFGDGMATASPFLFAESLASSPLGHAAILLGAQGPSLAMACGDASAAVAMSEAWRQVRRGRIDRAICGALEIASPALTAVLARLAAREKVPPFIGDGVAAFVLEEEGRARAAGAPILARITGAGSAGDPLAGRTDWSHDPAAWAAAHDAALATADGAGRRLARIFRHDPPSREASRAERLAIERLRVERGVPPATRSAGEGLGAEGGAAIDAGVHHVFGCYAAAGGLSVAAAILASRECQGAVLVSAGSWGGSTSALVLEPATP